MNTGFNKGTLESRSKNQRPVTSDQVPATRVPIFLFLLLLFLGFVFPGTGPFAAGLDQKQDAFKETVYRLSSFADRSTGTAGNQAAAAYIKERLERLGFETVGTHKFAVPVILDEKSTLTISDRNLSISIRSLRGNAVTPQTIPPPGIQAPLVYAGNGDLQNLNGKAIEGAIILMEIESGKNWLTVADLGAKALIYVYRRTKMMSYY